MHPVPAVRIAVIQAVRQWALPEVMQAHERLLREDPDPQVRLAAVQQLWRKRDAGKIPLLRMALEDPVEEVRDEAAWHLKKMGALDD
jgi:HEAT repeat protein